MAWRRLWRRCSRSFSFIVAVFFCELLWLLYGEVSRSFDQDAFVGWTKSGQALLDYMGTSLQVVYESMPDMEERRVTFVNVGRRRIPAEPCDWAVYFNDLQGYKAAVSSPRRSMAVSQFVLRHHSGWLYSLMPGGADQIPAFKGVAPGGNVSFTLPHRLGPRSASFPRWYVAGADPYSPLAPRILVSTLPDQLEHVVNVPERPPAPRYHDDVIDPSGVDQLLQTELRDTEGARGRIVPTPWRVEAGDKWMQIDATWVVEYEGGLKEEADFLAGRLNLKTVEVQHRFARKSSNHTGLSRVISLCLSDLTDRFPSPAFDNNSALRSHGAYEMIARVGSGVEIRGHRDPVGVFYGVQSLLSLLAGSVDGRGLREGVVTDAPRMPYRGLMLDVARNFITKEDMKATLDLMAQYKLNKLHLHLSDDQGWRLEIPGLPELTEIGARRGHDLLERTMLFAFHGSGPFPAANERYTVADYRELLQHASRRHIEVIPEIDMPGHMHAAIQSMRMRFIHLSQRGATSQNVADAGRSTNTAGLANQGGIGLAGTLGCEDKLDDGPGGAAEFLLSDPGDLSEYLGVGDMRDTVANPCMNSTYAFVEHVIKAFVDMHANVQPLKTFHLGGDEVPSEALTASPYCRCLLRDHPKLSGPRALQRHFTRRVVAILVQHGLNVQAWEEGFGGWGGDARPPNLTDWLTTGVGGVKGKGVVDWEKGGAELVLNTWNGGKTVPFTFANAGYKVVLSHAHVLYLDHPSEPDDTEPGLVWATGYTSSRKIFHFLPATPPVVLSGSDVHRRLCDGYGMKDCVELTQPQNIIGLEASLFGELVRTRRRLHYMLYPRLLAVAERAWHAADWERDVTGGVNVTSRRRADWARFAATLGHKELQRLDGQRVRYRLPLPGAIVESSEILVTTEFPGLPLQYSDDEKITWYNHTAGLKLKPGCARVHLRTMSHDFKRASRSALLRLAPKTQGLPVIRRP